MALDVVACRYDRWDRLSEDREELLRPGLFARSLTGAYKIPLMVAHDHARRPIGSAESCPGPSAPA
jgi:hypothetical protein